MPPGGPPFFGGFGGPPLGLLSPGIAPCKGRQPLGIRLDGNYFLRPLVIIRRKKKGEILHPDPVFAILVYVVFICLAFVFLSNKSG